jgi:hypothetical protein
MRLRDPLYRPSDVCTDRTTPEVDPDRDHVPSSVRLTRQGEARPFDGMTPAVASHPVIAGPGRRLSSYGYTEGVPHPGDLVSRDERVPDGGPDHLGFRAARQLRTRTVEPHNAAFPVENHSQIRDGIQKDVEQAGQAGGWDRPPTRANIAGHEVAPQVGHEITGYCRIARTARAGTHVQPICPQKSLLGLEARSVRRERDR